MSQKNTNTISQIWDDLGIESREQVLSHSDHTYEDFGCQTWESMDDMLSQTVDGCYAGVDRHSTQLDSVYDALIHTQYAQLSLKIQKILKTGLADQGIVTGDQDNE